MRGRRPAAGGADRSKTGCVDCQYSFGISCLVTMVEEPRLRGTQARVWLASKDRPWGREAVAIANDCLEVRVVSPTQGQDVGFPFNRDGFPPARPWIGSFREHQVIQIDAVPGCW